MLLHWKNLLFLGYYDSNGNKIKSGDILKKQFYDLKGIKIEYHKVYLKDKKLHYLWENGEPAGRITKNWLNNFKVNKI